MTRYRTWIPPTRAATAGLLGAAGLFLAPFTGHGPGGCKGGVCRDAAAPTVSISTPTADTSVVGTVSVAGSSSDNVGVAAVAVSIDGGAWQPADGTSSWSWSWSTTSVPDGTHTVAAQASDKAGNVRMVSESVIVANATADTTVPVIEFAGPLAGSTVTGTVDVTGSASDDVAVASVELAVDGGSWQPAVGTTSWTWSWPTTSLTNGDHTIAARATDTSDNGNVVSETVTVQNADTTAPSVSIAAPSSGAFVSGTVEVDGSASDDDPIASVRVSVDDSGWQLASGTTSWSWVWDTTGLADGTHTIAVRASDSSGNVTTRSESVHIDNTAPATQGSWVSPEGVTINVDSSATWTIAQVYSILKANALDLDRLGPGLTINVQDQYTSQTQTNATYYMGSYSSVASTMWLQGVNSGFAARPDDILAHEYGHAWSTYWFYMAHQASWTDYENARWTTSDGSLTLTTDSRTGTSYSWRVEEIVADDYRLLFGSSLAVSERPTHLNSEIVDSRNVPELSSFLLNAWRTP
jgi:Bacterial Ig domain